MSQAIIIANGNISPKLQLHLNHGDFLVGVDAGALYFINNNHCCDLAIGDFDSVTKKQLDKIKKKAKEIKIYSPEKDFTDTELALEEVVKRGFKNIIISGAIGTRMDHSLANILLLEKYCRKDVRIRLIDEHNVVEIVTEQKKVPQSKDFFYVSFISLSDSSVISLKDFKYPLSQKEIRRGQTICISNETKGKAGSVKVHKGKILMIRSRD